VLENKTTCNIIGVEAPHTSVTLLLASTTI
jgi:hypothetical protein